MASLILFFYYYIDIFLNQGIAESFETLGLRELGGVPNFYDFGTLLCFKSVPNMCYINGLKYCNRTVTML